jgi:TolB-like protein
VQDVENRDVLAPSVHAKAAPVALVGAKLGATILVTPFDPCGHPSALLNLNAGLSKQMMIALHQLGECVVSQPVEGRWANADQGAVGYAGVLTGDMAVEGDRMSVSAVLIDVATRRVLWGTSFQREFEPGDIVSARDEVADSLSHAVHQFISGETCPFEHAQPNNGAVTG